ncbi:MAG: helix-turn-helix domain-containing protein [Flavobacterium sp.]|uniref:helix-turn-helix domain-containing protein n=1 Tax=Flavobacterium sp. TaxID=239 RepID=UPI00391DFB7C
MDKEYKKELLIKFGSNLRKLRLEKGFSQEQLANELGVEVSQISRIERGLINTSVLMLHSISKILKTPEAKFFEFDK